MSGCVDADANKCYLLADPPAATAPAHPLYPGDAAQSDAHTHPVTLTRRPTHISTAESATAGHRGGQQTGGEAHVIQN